MTNWGEPMTETRYAAPATIEEAVTLMAGANASGRILAGGTDLLVQLRAGMVAPGLIVDVKRIREMTAIDETGGRYCIGAAASGAAIGEHPTLAKAWPAWSRRST